MSRITLFGPSKRKIWKQLCERIDADFLKGNWTKSDKIEAWHGDWMITIDTHKQGKRTFTRIRAPYHNRDDFQFLIYRENMFHRIGKRFGIQDVEVGFPDFDQDFIIQGNDERKLRMLFENPHIRELISFQPAIHLEIRPDSPIFHPPFPQGIHELYFQYNGIIRDIDQLHDLYDLFAITLDHLCHIGTAYEDDPNFGKW